MPFHTGTLLGAANGSADQDQAGIGAGKELDFTVYRMLMDLGSVVAALLGVATLRIWRGQPAWDWEDGVNTSVDDVSYVYALVAMVLGMLWCAVLLKWWKVLRTFTGRGRIAAVSSRSVGDLCPGPSSAEVEMQTLEDKV